jgi:hypothetical protein
MGLCSHRWSGLAAVLLNNAKVDPAMTLLTSHRIAQIVPGSLPREAAIDG